MTVPTDRVPSGPAALTAVLFDMDGVLVDSTDAHVAAWNRFLEERGLEPPEAGVRSLFGRRAAEAVAMLLHLDLDSPELEEALGDLERYADELLEGSGPGQNLVYGAAGVVADLADAGWRLAVATSARRHIAEHSLGRLRSAFEALVTAEDVSHGKPHPEVYLTAAARLEVPPPACVVVEDSVAGVEAGVRAGMHVVAVPTTAPEQRLVEAGAEVVLGHVAELQRYLERSADR
ncbi:MAG: HAD family hydrolase [Nitriliruptoraceae bacterium]